MEAGKPSVAGCDVGDVGCRFGRVSAGGRATDPVTSFFGVEVPRDGGFKSGGFNGCDAPSPVSNKFGGNAIATFPAFGPCGAGVKLGRADGAIKFADTSPSGFRGVALLSPAIPAVVS